MPDPERLHRLDEAIATWMRFRAGHERGTRAEFLARHAELRDLLEPMLAEESTPDGEDAAGARRLGEYRLLRELGRGGMGIVHEAHQVSLDRRIAVKVLAPHLAASPRAIARFKREATTAAHLRHPGIVEILAVGDDGDAHWFAMELVHGERLDRHAASRDLTSRDQVAQLVEIVAKVADALAFAHARGVTHRDVKPANVLVRHDGTPVLTDFGLACDESLPSLSQTGEFAGTPDYVAPEQARGERAAVDARSDVFSLGATLYEVLTRRRPFAGATTLAVLDAIQRDEPRRPRELNPSLAPDLEAIVLKALEKSPSARYQTAAEFAADLRDFLAYRPVRAKRATRWRGFVRWTRREPAWAALALLLVVGAFSATSVGGYLWAKRDSITLGEASARAAALEVALTEAFGALGENAAPRALARFRALQDEHPDSVEARLGLVLATFQQDPEAARRLLDAPVGAEAAAFARLRRVVDRRLRRVTAESLPTSAPASSALEAFTLGMIEERAGLLEGGHGPRWRRAHDHYVAAVHCSRRARPFLHFAWARAAAGCNDRESALAAVAAIERLWPANPVQSRWIGHTLAKFEPERASAELRAAIDAAPSHAFLHHNLGIALTGARRSEEAEAAFRKSLALDPELHASRVRLAKLLLARGDRAGAVAEAECLVAGTPTAAAWHEYGNLLAHMGRNADACTAYEKAIALEPEAHAPRHSLGVVLTREKRFEAAFEQLQKAAELDPECHEVWHQLGYRHAALERWREGELAFAKAIELYPEEASAHTNLGVMRFMQQDLEGAASAFRRSLALDARQPSTTLKLGVVLALQGKLPDATAWLHRALASEPGVAKELEGYARSALGALKKPAVARLFAEVTIEHDPRSAWAHARLASILKQRRTVHEWRAELRRWAELHEEDVEAWAALAEALASGDEATAEPKAALAALDHAIAKCGDDARRNALLERRAEIAR